jgi:hypothetical protein
VAGRFRWRRALRTRDRAPDAFSKAQARASEPTCLERTGYALSIFCRPAVCLGDRKQCGGGADGRCLMTRVGGRGKVVTALFWRAVCLHGGGAQLWLWWVVVVVCALG